MSGQAIGLVNKGLPWRSDVRWPVVAAEAVALIGLGIFMLVDNEAAGRAVLQIIGVVVLVASIVLGTSSFRSRESGLGAFDAFRAGVGVTVGLIATVSWWSEYIEAGAVRLILGWGLVAYSALHLAGLVAERERTSIRPSIVVTVVLTLVLGIILLTSSDNVSGGRITLLGTIFLGFGALLGAWAYYLYARARDHGLAGQRG
jgi:uncharacterized membrane protein HdeD (DUF308 family)